MKIFHDINVIFYTYGKQSGVEITRYYCFLIFKSIKVASLKSCVILRFFYTMCMVHEDGTYQ